MLLLVGVLAFASFQLGEKRVKHNDAHDLPHLGDRVDDRVGRKT